MAKATKLKTVATKVELPVARYALSKILGSIFEKVEKECKTTLRPHCDETKPINLKDESGETVISLGFKVTTNIRRLDTENILKDHDDAWKAKYYIASSDREEIKPAFLDGLDRRLKNVVLTEALCRKIVDTILSHQEDDNTAAEQLPEITSKKTRIAQKG